MEPETGSLHRQYFIRKNADSAERAARFSVFRIFMYMLYSASYAVSNGRLPAVCEPQNKKVYLSDIT
ncbi:MAG: hypothetical protein CW338_01955 [Clostridiales bacterium]|nr:hypothetical protein [Clostridiales bacterium]